MTGKSGVCDRVDMLTGNDDFVLSKLHRLMIRGPFVMPGGHAPMSGTSMACPAVTGVLTRLLANTPAVLNMPRTAARANAIKALLYAQAQSLSLGILNEGKGLPA